MTILKDSPDVAKRNAEISFLMFAIGGGLGLLNLYGTVPFGAGFEMVSIATNLADHNAYANPLFVLPTGPSAVCPPFYPLVLALLIKVLHAPTLIFQATAVGSLFANAFTSALLPRVSWLFYGDVVPGITAAVLWLMAAQLMPSWDANWTLPAILFFCLYSAAALGKKNIFFSGLSSGLLAGSLLLLNPMSLLVVLPWVGHLLLFRRSTLKHTIAYCCILLGTAALVVFPWTLRNHRELGGFVLRTGLGLNLYQSNNDCSRTNLVEDLQTGCASIYQANFNLSEAQAYRALGEIKQDRKRVADTEDWIRAHRTRFFQLTLSRIVAFWFPRTVEHPFKAAVIWGFTLLSIPGLALMAYRREKVVVFVLSVLLIYPLLYYVILSDVRYRYPILWLSLLPAGYFLRWFMQHGNGWKLKVAQD